MIRVSIEKAGNYHELKPKGWLMPLVHASHLYPAFRNGRSKGYFSTVSQIFRDYSHITSAGKRNLLTQRLFKGGSPKVVSGALGCQDSRR